MAQTTASARSVPRANPNPQAPTAPKRLRQRETEALMKGPKINIFTGEGPTANLLFPVPITLITHFSPRWKDEIAEKKAKAVYVLAHKDAIKMIIEWMAAGGEDSAARGAIPCPGNDVLKLVCLKMLVTHLEMGPLVDRILEGIDHLTRRYLSFEQMVGLVSVANIPCRTRQVLQRNLVKWVGAFGGDEWQNNCSRASIHGGHGRALAILSMLRAVAERNRREWESSKRYGQGKNQRRRLFRPALPVLENEARFQTCNHGWSCHGQYNEKCTGWARYRP